jgi:CRP-like cAMP-binding protein
MFKILTEQQRSQLSLLVEFREFQPQHILLRQHEAVSGLYIVLAGSLEQSVHDEHDNVEIDLGDIEPGMVVGEISLLAGVEAHATITVKEKWFVLPTCPPRATLLFTHFPATFSVFVVGFFSFSA